MSEKLKEQFIPCSLAFALKEVGFDEECFSAYRNYDGEESLIALNKWGNSKDFSLDEFQCAAPLFRQAFEWFREKGYFGSCHQSYRDEETCVIEGYYAAIFWITKENKSWSIAIPKDYGMLEDPNELFKTFREAEIACVERLIELIKPKP
jgi:hypothetical protein